MYISYFQNFTNTYADIDTLKSRYDSALVDERIVGLSIATRPDCIDENIAKLLSSYTQKYYVSVELGLQTINENVASFINRGYSNQEFLKAVEILKKYNISVVAHIMVGLPKEEKDDIKNIVEFLNNTQVDGIKIHSTYVIKNTKLEDLYNKGLYTPVKVDEYIEKVIFILTHLRKDIVIHRISGDAPKDLLVAPDWSKHKKIVLNTVENTMRQNNLTQGQTLGLTTIV